MTIAFLSAIGFLIIIIKALGLKKVIKYEIYIDILFTIGFLSFSGGTYSGIVNAIKEGVLLSLMLLILRIFTKK